MFKRYIKSMAQILLLIIIDGLAYYTAVILAVFTRTNIVHFFIKDIPNFEFSIKYTLSLWWVPLIFIVFIQFQNLYYNRKPFWEETKALVKSLTIALFFIFLTIYFQGRYNNVLRLFFIFLWFYSLILFPLYRYWGKILLYKMGIWKENVIVLGADKKAIITVKSITKDYHLGYNVIGMLDDNPKKIGTYENINGNSYKIYGEIDNFHKFVDVLDIQTVFIAKSYPQKQLRELINKVYKHVKRMIIVPDITGVSLFNSELYYLFRERLFMIKVHNNLNSNSNILIKRIFDLIFSSIFFFLSTPLFLIFALIIKLTSKGPAIFSHNRIGKDGKVFKAYKFRSMYRDAEERLKKILDTDKKAKKEWDTSYKLKNDPRITPIGKFLRKTSLDELPQIFNIFKGEMSLVGPRPVIQKEIDKYYRDYKEYYFSVTPGLTGLWQISGRSDTDYNFRVQTDVWYIQNWSLWLDIIILFQTPLVVIKAKGAY